ncbi:MAG: LPS-assembly protein LptD [Desulfomonilaceae bacterium]
MIPRKKKTCHFNLVLHALITFVSLTVHPCFAVAVEPSVTERTIPSSILPGDLPVKMTAERLSYDYRTNTYSARGNVTLSQGNTRLRADSIVYEAKTGELTAFGGVIVRTGSDVIEAEKVTINLKASTGVLFNGKLLLTRQHVYLEGKELEKKGASDYSVKEGSFTTCDGATPDWKITGKDLDVTLEGYGTLKHGFFYVRDIPVFYLPWLIYPAKRERQTGFLMPSTASSTLRGLDFRVPFFLNISRSIDATISPRFCSKRAIQTGLEFRYNPTENLKGRFYGEYTYDWKYGPVYDPVKNLFYALWRHDQDWSGAARLKTNLQWVSDRNYFDIWGGRFDKRLRVRYMESNAILYRQTNNFLLQAEARYFDNLDLRDNAKTVQNLPILTATLFDRQAPYTPLYISSNLTYDYFHAPLMNNQWLGARLQWDTRIGLPVSFGRYIKFNPSMTYFARGYDGDYYKHDKSVSSINSIRTDLYQINTDIFTDIDKIYEGSLFGFQKVKHTIRPRVVWTYRPLRSRQIYPYFDEIDRMDEVSLLTAEVRQSLVGRVSQGQYLDFASFSLSQGYDFHNTRTAEDPLGEHSPLKSHWTITQAELSIRPHSLLDLRAQAEYDLVLNRARSYSLNLGVMDHRGDTIQILHQFAEDELREDLNRQTNLNLQVKVTSAIDFFLENQYTHQFNFAYFTSLGLNYHPQCWNILLRYSESREQDPVTHTIKDADQTFFLTLSLYGLGQVYRYSRDWSDMFGVESDLASNWF